MTPSGQRIRQIRRIVAAAAVTAGLAGPAVAQEGIERARQMRTVADQKAASDIAETIKTAEGLAKVSQQKAIERLKQAKLGLDLSAEISSTKRKELIEQLDAKIAAIEGKTAAAQDPKAGTAKSDARKAMEAAAQEATDVAAALAKADQHLAVGQVELARRVIGEAARKYPNNPSLLVSQKQDEFASQVRAEKELSRMAAANWTEQMRDVARSATPAVGEIQFPDAKKWKDITQRRLQPAIKLTPKEERILESLNKTIGANFKDRPFEEALQEISNMIDQPLFIDKKSLEDAGLDLSRRVTFQNSVTARTALRAILQTNGLTFVVKDEMIQVLTLEKAQQTLVSRSYYLGDLVAGNGPFGNAVLWGPVASYQQMMQNAQLIVDAITSSVDPLCWRNGEGHGPCSITFNLTTMSVVVRASTEVHASLGNALSGKK
jgi:hypothetical protein